MLHHYLAQELPTLSEACDVTSEISQLNSQCLSQLILTETFFYPFLFYPKDNCFRFIHHTPRCQLFYFHIYHSVCSLPARFSLLKQQFNCCKLNSSPLLENPMSYLRVHIINQLCKHERLIWLSEPGGKKYEEHIIISVSKRGLV